jgi:hypothetical protein
MNAHRIRFLWFGVLGLILLAFLAGAIFPGIPSLWSSARAAPGSTTALTPGQNAAIQGAEQLLLSAPVSHFLFLPAVDRH